MTENYRQDIRLHLGHTIPSSVSVVQYDTARELHFYIDDYIIPNETEIRIYIKKPSGKEIYNHCLLVDDEIIMYPTTQMFAECGLNLAQIQIVKNNKTLTSFRFDIEVSESYAENAIPSTNEFTILDALIIEAREIIKAEAARVEAENTRNENEQIRIENENTRILNENNRTETENSRVEAENNRILAETNRVNAENAREVAELKRQEDTSNAIDNCNTATLNANHAAQNANNAAENANSVSEEIEQKALNGDFSATISHVEAISGEPDTEASVENTGTAKDAKLLFTIPKGTPAGFGTVSAHVVDTGDDEAEVTIETDGTNEQKNFNFTFKNIKGKQGDPGEQGYNDYRPVTVGQDCPFTNVLTIANEEKGNPAQRKYAVLQNPDTGLLDDMPSALQGVMTVFYRDVYYRDADHVLVKLIEAFPINGRIWTNFYNSGIWSGWKEAGYIDISQFFKTTGGTINGNVNVTGKIMSNSTISGTKVFGGDKVYMWTDSEGGNIEIKSPTDGIKWQQDSYDTDNYRIYKNTNGKLGPFYKFAGNGAGGTIATDSDLNKKQNKLALGNNTVTNLNSLFTGCTWFNADQNPTGTKPFNTYGFIIAFQSGGSNYFQIAIPYGNDTYDPKWRTYVNGAWQAWKPFNPSIINNLNDVLANTTSGKIAGALALKSAYNELKSKYIVGVVKVNIGDLVGYTARSGEVSCAKSGYTPFGIVGRAVGGTVEPYKINISNLFINGNNISYSVFNISSSTITGYYINVRVLYQKN